MSADELARAEARIHELEATAAALAAELSWSDRRAEMLSGTLFGLRHDLRAHLRAASGFAEILGRRAPSDDGLAHYLDQISENLALAQVVLDSQLEILGSLFFNRTPGDLAASIRDLEATTAPSRLRTEVPARRLSVPLSQDRLNTLVLNAVGAVAAGAKSGGALNVEVRVVPAWTNDTRSRHVCLCVAAPAAPGADGANWVADRLRHRLERSDPVAILAEVTAGRLVLMVWMPLVAYGDAS